MFKYNANEMEKELSVLFKSIGEVRESAQQIVLKIVAHTLNHRNTALVERFVQLMDSDDGTGLRRDSLYIWMQRHSCCDFTTEGVGSNKKTVITFNKERAPKPNDVEENERRMAKARAEKWWTVNADKDKSNNTFDLLAAIQKLSEKAAKQYKKASKDPSLLVPDETGKARIVVDAPSITVLNALAAGKGEFLAKLYLENAAKIH